MEFDDSDRQDKLWLSVIAGQGREGEKALNGLHGKYHRRLLRFVMNLGATQELAEEVVQDTFIKVWKSAGTFREDAKPSSWIHSIARYTLISDKRRVNLEDTVDEAGWGAVEANVVATCTVDALSEVLVREALQDCYDDAYGRFSVEFPAGAQALNRVVQDKWSVRDVATLLQRTEGATREYLSQCRKKLKRFLEPCAELLKELA